MKLSVIIPTYNRRKLLEDTLAALTRQDLAPSEFEVIVVNDGSSDDTESFLARANPPFRFSYVTQRNAGQAAARNTGMRVARGDVLVFLDDDIVAARQLLSVHAAAHDRHENVVAFGPVVARESLARDTAGRLVRSYYNDLVYAPLRNGRTPDWPLHARIGPNTSIRRDLLVHVGGFDEEFATAHEDAELGLRVWCAGARFRFLPDAEAEHTCLKSEEQLLDEAAPSGSAEWKLCRKYPSYRPHSIFAKAQSSPLFMPGITDLLLRGRSRRWIVARALRASRRVPLAPRNRLLALELTWRAIDAAISQAGSWERFRAEFLRRVPGLLYHSVGPLRAGMYPSLCVSPGQFESQLRWLRANGYAGIRVSDWLAWVEAGKPLPDKPVFLTFDDGYTDLADHAFPLLLEYGFNATVFLPTACIGGSNVWDHDGCRAPVPLLTVDAIRFWSERGIEFGAHSRTHPALDQVDESALVDEVRGSCSDLQQIVGPPEVFAYPYGLRSAAVRQAVMRSFRAAFTTDEGLNHLGTDLYALRRTMVLPADSGETFAARVRFGISVGHQAHLGLRRLMVDRW
jgi:GT2 family glycosyltransferase/peptidoglycan/xylan/chitin deacetylase (PgdA/CDA1 family)